MEQTVKRIKVEEEEDLSGEQTVKRMKVEELSGLVKDRIRIWMSVAQHRSRMKRVSAELGGLLRCSRYGVALLPKWRFGMTR